MRVREMAVAGQFYPSSSKSIEEIFSYYNELLEKHLEDKTILERKSRAVIVPHAGYVYSGFTANIAYRILANSGLKRIVVIGPSHRVYFLGSSVGDFDIFDTPFGELKCAIGFVKELQQKFNLKFFPDAHHEHSTEVQMPFIKRYLQAEVVEVVYGDENPANLAPIIEYALKDSSTGVIISTDLSHFYNIEKAEQLDNICIDAVVKLDPNGLHKGCEACGKIGMEAMIMAAKNLDLKPLLLDYRTSADASGDRSQVVGYLSTAFIDHNQSF
jgi:AmmeMemoRadiSam system protein B